MVIGFGVGITVLAFFTGAFAGYSVGLKEGIKFDKVVKEKHNDKN